MVKLGPVSYDTGLMAVSSLSPLGAFFLGLLISASLIPLIIRLARRQSWISPIDFRRKNKKQIPLMGGFAIFAGYSASLFLESNQGMIALWWAALPIVIVGLLDDVVQLRARAKFLIQGLSVMGWLFWIPSSELVLVQVGCPPGLAIGLTAFWVIGLVNAVNMIDGMDGEASTVSLIASLVLALMLWGQGGEWAALGVSGACLGFLIFNRPPARIYMGDSGSSFLGFYLAAQASTLTVPQSSPLLILAPLFLLAFPEVDAILAMWRRSKYSSSPFRGDRDHLHHKLQKMGFNVKQSLAVIGLVTVYSSLTAIGIWKANSDFDLGIMVSLALVGLLSILAAVYVLEFRQAHHVSTFSQSLLDRHLHITHSPVIRANDFRAVVYDLLPYYKELQGRGIGDVQEFIHDFSSYIQSSHPDGQLVRIGSYTLIAIEHGRSVNEMGYRNSIVGDFFRLLSKHSVMKNDHGVPWGLSFYHSRSKAEEFLRKFELAPYVYDGVQSKEAGQIA